MLRLSKNKGIGYRINLRKSIFRKIVLLASSLHRPKFLRSVVDIVYQCTMPRAGVASSELHNARPMHSILVLQQSSARGSTRSDYCVSLAGPNDENMSALSMQRFRNTP